jgi:hypothetical protein
MNTLTKVAAGQYAYRGFEIVRATWIRSSPWVIKHELLRGLSYSTLRETVRRVDCWFADRDAGRKQPDFVAKALDSLSQPSLVRVPAAFFEDHESRDCEPYCEPVKKAGRHVWLRLDDPGLEELLSDARHYADPTWTLDSCYFGLKRSAVATVKAIEAATAKS